MKTIFTLFLSFFFGISNASEAENSWLAQTYGFQVRGAENLKCNQGAPTHPSMFTKTGGVCESDLGGPQYMAVMWRDKNANKFEMQRSVLIQMLKHKKVSANAPFSCAEDKSFVDKGGKGASFVDCVWGPSTDETNKYIYLSFFYFSPNPENSTGNVLVFSNFGFGGEAAGAEVKERTRTMSSKILFVK